MSISLLIPGPYSELLKRLATEIERHRETVATTPDRSQRIGAMQDLLKSLGSVTRSLKRSARPLRPLLMSHNGVLPVLGELMSAEGLVRLGRTGPVAWDLGERELRDQNSSRSIDPVHIDGLTAGSRQRLARRLGPKILDEMIKALQEPVQRMLDVEKSMRGGRPEDIYRNHVIRELATFYTAASHEPAPTGKTGPFFDLCYETLIRLGLSTDGLDSRIRRVLRPRTTRLRARQNPS